MEKNPKYYIVEAAALPEVFLKVAEAKRMLDTGEASTVGEATKLTGISHALSKSYVRAHHNIPAHIERPHRRFIGHTFHFCL